MDHDQFARQLARVQELRAAGQFAEAGQILDTLAAALPDNAQVAYQRAWLHDVQGQERAALPWYERAIEQGLSGDELRGALLGLGSTYRALGEYERAVATLEQGRQRFPAAREFAVFLALARYNQGDGRAAVALLLHTLLDTSADPEIRAYERALRFYADHLDETWEGDAGV